jgi:glycosyltransferase involved in cell wall biosynthesis
VPVITTGVGGVKDLLGDFIFNKEIIGGCKICERGILCQTNDADALANGIAHIIDNGKDSQDHNILKAREYVMQNYSDKKLASNIRAFYSQMLNCLS